MTGQRKTIHAKWAHGVVARAYPSKKWFIETDLGTRRQVTLRQAVKAARMMKNDLEGEILFGVDGGRLFDSEVLHSS